MIREKKTNRKKGPARSILHDNVNYELPQRGVRQVKASSKSERKRELRIEKLRKRQEELLAVQPPLHKRSSRFVVPIEQSTPQTAAELAALLSEEAALKAGVEPSPAAASEDSIHYRPPRRVHLGLLITVIVLLCFGMIMLFSASMTNAFNEYGDSSYWVIRQVLFTALALVVMYVITKINPKRWNHGAMAIIVYLVTLFLLIIVLIPGIGREINGQRRWLPLLILPNMNFQPSEIAKLATVYCGAVYYSSIRKMRSSGKLVAKSKLGQVFKDVFYDFFLPGILILIWCALISQQSHWSSIIIIMLTLMIVFFGAGIRPRSWSIMLGILAAIVILAMSVFTAFKTEITAYVETNPQMDHILTRLNVFSGDSTATVDESYQSRHALISIGSGGPTGVGLGLGRQKFGWLPEIHNDYVFSNIGEELGFVGSTAVVLLFVIFFLLGISVTMKTQSIYMQIMALGFSSLIAIQAFLSIAVNLMVIPPTGISLPLFSYGGTSNIFFLVGIGFLLSVSKFGPKDVGGLHYADFRRRHKHGKTQTV